MPLKRISIAIVAIIAVFSLSQSASAAILGQSVVSTTTATFSYAGETEADKTTTVYNIPYGWTGSYSYQAIRICDDTSGPSVWDISGATTTIPFCGTAGPQWVYVQASGSTDINSAFQITIGGTHSPIGHNALVYVHPDYAGSVIVPDYAFYTGFPSPFPPESVRGGPTRFLDPYTPANGSFASSSPVTFSYDFSFNCSTSFGVYDTVGIDLRDTSQPGTEPTTPTQSIIACGGGTYYTQITLVAGDNYIWRPVMEAASGTTTPFYGNWYSYQATSTPDYTPYTPYNPPPGTVSSTTNPIPQAPCGVLDVSGCFQNAISYLFYPTIDATNAFLSIQVSNRAPFVYAYQINQIRQTILSGNTASSTPLSLSVNLWKLPGSATTSIVLISQAKIAAVPYSGLIYSVLTILIYLGMAEYIYFRVIRLHDVTTPK